MVWPLDGARRSTIPGLFDTPIYGQGEAADPFKERLDAGIRMQPK